MPILVPEKVFLTLMWNVFQVRGVSLEKCEEPMGVLCLQILAVNPVTYTTNDCVEVCVAYHRNEFLKTLTEDMGTTKIPVSTFVQSLNEEAFFHHIRIPQKH